MKFNDGYLVVPACAHAVVAKSDRLYGASLRHYSQDGPGELGPNADGPGELGPKADGPGELGPKAEGPGELGPNADGPGELGPANRATWVSLFMIGFLVSSERCVG